MLELGQILEITVTQQCHLMISSWKAISQEFDRRVQKAIDTAVTNAADQMEDTDG